jgi:hypothetical protein
LGYGEIPAIRELSTRESTLRGDTLVVNSEWKAWRGILDYLACVEHARAELHRLPKGLALGSKDVVPAQYHAASMVFFAQAALDNLAEWLRERMNSSLAHRDCVFHRERFREALAAYDPQLGALVVTRLPYIESLERYRHTWIHRISGGAQMYCDRNPGAPGAVPELCVPIDPRVFLGDAAAYASRVNAVCQANDGVWLYPVGTFADQTANGCRDFLISVLERGLGLFK